MGTQFDQQFYALRYEAGQTMRLPFAKQHFNALIELSTPVSRAVMQSVALQLLQHGMRAAVCHGDDCEMMGEVIDELVDEYDFNHEGRTVYASAHDDDTLEEVIDYFILPNGLAEVGLIIVLGGESEFDEVVETFDTIDDESRECVVIESEETEAAHSM